MPEKTEPEVEILGNHLPAIRRLLEERKDLPGSIMEFGCYNGASTFELAKLGRDVVVLDTFDGVPAEDFTESLDQDRPGKFRPPSDILFRLWQVPNILPIVGRFADTLPTLKMEVVLAYVDSDLFESTRQSLTWLAENLVTGGAIVCDDVQSHRGVRLAIHEFLDAHHNALFDGHEIILWR